MEENIKIAEAIKKLDEAGKKILLVTKDMKLTGIITDGDVRRWVLRKGSFEEKVCNLMHRNPKVVGPGETQKAKRMMLELQIEAVPVIDENNIPLDIIFLRDIIEPSQQEYGQIDIPVVIMAGGKGTRLYPYTNILPKPLIPIGTDTILERIIESFRKNGNEEFWLVLNYKKNLIKAYLDEKDKPYRIHYKEEENYYGTCGGLSLLEDEISDTFFVSNCDVLLDIDYAKLLDFHCTNQNEITVVTSLKHIQIPYGVVELGKEGEIEQLSEKPMLNYNVNTGIYVVEASVIKDIPRHQVFHMTDLMNKLLKEKRKIGAYPITDHCWQDMGELKEMYKMSDAFRNQESLV